MRGKERYFVWQEDGTGITPAYAGKSAPVRVFALLEPGSPPRMRGKATPKEDRCKWTGITPAYAGKRSTWRASQRAWWDHPRVCGEKRVVLLVLCCGLGSPPRMRGKVVHGVVLALDVGITPAYAGKSFFVRVGLGVDRDHPRVCGEKSPN